jgi:DNA-binding LacI/PurR family transcriptional regulator
MTAMLGNVGLLVPDLLNPHFAAVVKGVQTRARESGYWVFVTDTDEDPGVETDRIRALVRQVDGMAVDVQTDIVIDRPCAEVAAYAADPSHAPDWYVNIDSVEWLTEPPLRVGSRLAFVARFLGRRLAL